MPTPDFISDLRRKIGTDPLWLSGVTAVVLRGDEMLMVRRSDTGAWTPVTGIIDPGETPEICARREAEEEIGFRLRDLRPCGSVVPSAGTLTERMYLYIAEVSCRDRVGEGGGVAQEGEAIEIVEIALPELFRMARAGEIEDAKTLILVQSLMLDRLLGRGGQMPAS